ncbi:HSPB1-associated protein 1 homolog [Ptychodera flava]|uniref:HSPB1-associated protein 1 homolog n=1 Tax=Ptychodera flava TaxID=63121 RepID=UPI00396A92C6
MSEKPFAPDIAKRLVLETLTAPVVFKGMISDWPCMNWTIQSLADVLGDQEVKFRIGPKEWSEHGVLWERDCCYRDATLHQFSDWLANDTSNLPEDNPLKDFEISDSWCYADYKYMAHIFQDKTDVLKAVRWSDFGFHGRDGTESTLWIGSVGSHTPCHYDTYGCNLVAQIHGKKIWYMFPPIQTAMMYPTRIPYEESSVFSQVNVKNPDCRRFPKFRDCTPYNVTLEPGDVLFVPRHWWHYVECVTPAISVNSWIELDIDDNTRVEEAITRTVTCSILSHVRDQDGTYSWLNPTEECTNTDTNLQYLQAAMKKLQAGSSSCDIKETNDNCKRETDGEPDRKKLRTFEEKPSPQEGSEQNLLRNEEIVLDEKNLKQNLFLKFVQCKSSFGNSNERGSEETGCQATDDGDHTAGIEFREPSNAMLVECLTHPSIINKVAELLKEKCSVK